MRDVSTTGGYVPFSILKYGDTVYNNKKQRESLRNLLLVVKLQVMLAVTTKQMQNQYIIRVLSQLYSQYPGCQGLVLPFL